MRIISFVCAMSSIVATVTLASFLSATSVQSQTASTSSEAAPPVDAAGNLHVPADYRAIYEYLGSWAIADEAGQGSKGLHEVYASPGTIAAFRKTGPIPGRGDPGQGSLRHRHSSDDDRDRQPCI